MAVFNWLILNVSAMAPEQTNHKEGRKKATVIDVAKCAGVSKSTVSLVLRGSESVSTETRKRVKKAIEELGYVYNREAAGLRSKRSNMVAIVANDLANPYLAQVIIGLEEQLDALGMIPVVVNINEDVERQSRIVATLKEYNIAGIIITPAPNTDPEWINQLLDAGFPLISIMREVANANAPSVMADNRLGAYLATRHLISLGHKRIAFIGGIETISDYHERKRGYLDALSEAGIKHDTSLIYPHSTKREGGMNATRALFDKDPTITAINCFTDVVAYGAITALNALGLTTGQQVSVTGFDDLEDSRLLSPSLTTIRVDARDIGREACDLLQRMLEGQRVPSKVLVDVELVVRESCCALR